MAAGDVGAAGAPPPHLPSASAASSSFAGASAGAFDSSPAAVAPSTTAAPAPLLAAASSSAAAAESPSEYVVDSEFFDSGVFTVTDLTVERPTALPYSNCVENDQVHVPGPFSFVEADWFLFLGGAVIVVNAMQLYVELTDGKEGLGGLIINQACLCYYCVEVVLRVMHFRWWYFRHEPFWNFMDLLVVILGVLDQWVISPMFLHWRDTSTTTKTLPLLWMVKLFRFVRVMKLFRLLCASDLRWTESAAFDYITSGFIICSIVVMGLETDIQSNYWDFIENIILLYFVFEIAVRLRCQGTRFFTSDDFAWNLLDFLIVLFGVCDQWVLHFWVLLATGDTSVGEVGQVVLLVRMLRLLRILRLVRLVKAVQPLYILALGVVEAMQSMFWVLVLTLVALYTFAILITRMIGHGELLGANADGGGAGTEMMDEHEEDVRSRLFSNVFVSMFTLFAIMNGQDWPDVEPLLREYPVLKITFVIFTIFASWALLSVMTGVVSDNMISARETQKEKDEAIDKSHMQAVEMAVRNVFVAADRNCTGHITKEQFYEVLDMPHYMGMLHDLAPSAEARDMRDLFTWLDPDEIGQVNFDDLFDGLRTLTQPVSGHCVLSLDKVVRRHFQRFEGNLHHLREDIARIRRRSQIRQASLKKDLQEERDACFPEEAKPQLRSQGTVTSFSCLSAGSSVKQVSVLSESHSEDTLTKRGDRR
eukprot:TRINITY_DN22864_c0_g1_i1.p1 TRINITY_DN22864_c0_g1~~TRINITY_DN22864_c0_g1_i1.p1  ORF type:complete len:705 (-),score=153.18 TRINITY_DN22864_c0_g1_i1:50-2164(-)